MGRLIGIPRPSSGTTGTKIGQVGTVASSRGAGLTGDRVRMTRVKEMFRGSRKYGSEWLPRFALCVQTGLRKTSDHIPRVRVGVWLSASFCKDGVSGNETWDCEGPTKTPLNRSG